MTRGLVALALFGVFMAGAAAWTRALHGALDPGHLLGVRALVWLAWLLPWAGAHRAEVGATARPWVFAAAALGSASLFGYVQALYLLPIPLATTLLYGTIPFFVLLLDWVFDGQAPRVGEVLLLAGAAGGVALIALPEGSYEMSTVSVSGVAAAVACGFFMAAYLEAVHRAAAGPNPMNLWYAAVLLACCLPPLAHPVEWTLRTLGLAVLYGLFSLIGQTFVVIGSRLTNAAVAGASTCLVPVFATLVGALGMGEGVSALELAGILVVVACATRASLVMGTRGDGRPPVPAPRDGGSAAETTDPGLPPRPAGPDGT